MRAASVNVLRARDGSIAVILLIALPLLIIALLMSLNMGLLVHGHTELQRCVDASALAAVHCLLDDEDLKRHPGSCSQRLERSRGEARLFCCLNPTMGHPGHHDHGNHDHGNHDHEDHPEDSIAFGCFPGDDGNPHFFHLPANSQADVHSQGLGPINCVHVRGCRYFGWSRPGNPHGSSLWNCFQGKVVCQATAVLDCHVVGFRPVFQHQPIPLVPIALCAKHNDEDEDGHDDDDDDDEDEDEDEDEDLSWQGQLNSRHFRDHWARLPDEHCFVPSEHGDDIPEIVIRLGCVKPNGNDDGNDGNNGNNGNNEDEDEDDDHDSNGCLILFQGPGACVRQIREGIGCDDLEGPWGGEFVLNPQGQVVVPAMLPGQAFNRERCERIAECLLELKRSHCPRIFPLYSCVRSDDGVAVITDFVAARVVSVVVENKGKGLTLVLQPTQMATACAVTHRDCGIGRPNPTPNRYVCKIRLVPPKPFKPTSSAMSPPDESL